MQVGLATKRLSLLEAFMAVPERNNPTIRIKAVLDLFIVEIPLSVGSKVWVIAWTSIGGKPLVEQTSGREKGIAPFPLQTALTTSGRQAPGNRYRGHRHGSPETLMHC